MDRREFFERVGNRPPAELEKIQWAYFFSKEAHRGQERDGGERYFEHPRDTALTMMQFGYTRTGGLVAGLLHDVLEDTHVPPRMIVHCFGSHMWQWLKLLSKAIPAEDPVTGFVTWSAKKSITDYFDALWEAEPLVQIVKCCDRLDNLRTIDRFLPDRQERQITETRQRVLPMAARHCPDVGRGIEHLLQKAEASLKALSTP